MTVQRSRSRHLAACVAALLGLAAVAATGAAASGAPQVVSAAVSATGPLPWTPAVLLHGRTAVWLRRIAADGGSVTLLRFDQAVVRLQLHAGSVDPGGAWRYGPEVLQPEIHSLVAAFNGGFKLSYAAAGFELEGRVVKPLVRGLASIVTYADGRTDIGGWGAGVPAGRSAVVSVRQNVTLLIDHGVIAGNVDSCVLACWGATVRNVLVTARSGLGVTAGGTLVWAAGEQLSVRALADALRAAGALRAIELDINPFWVAGYLYGHRGTPAAYPVVVGQEGIAGQLIRGGDTRDFFTVDAR